MYLKHTFGIQSTIQSLLKINRLPYNELQKYVRKLPHKKETTKQEQQQQQNPTTTLTTITTTESVF